MKNPDSAVFFTFDPLEHESADNGTYTLVELLFSHPEVRDRYLAERITGTITGIRPLDGDSFELCTRFELQYLIDGLLPAAGVVRKIDAKYSFTALGEIPKPGFVIIVEQPEGILRQVTTYPPGTDPVHLATVLQIERTIDTTEAERQLVKTILAAAPALLDLEHPSQKYVQ